MTRQAHAAGAGGPRAVESGAGSAEARAGRVGPRSALWSMAEVSERFAIMLGGATVAKARLYAIILADREHDGRW